MLQIKFSKPSSFFRFRNCIIIRLMDLSLALIAVLFLSPFLFFIAGLKFLCDKPPLFYNSKRVGLNGHVMLVFKFRTMVNDPKLIANYIRNLNRSGFEAIPLNAPIYTKLGRVFEKFQIVEMPQFINVIIGNMSFVGYRPLPENLLIELQQELGDLEITRRHARKPGLTGLAQLIGKDSINNFQRVYLENSLNDFLINERNSLMVIYVYLTLILDTVALVVLKRTFFLESNLNKLGVVK